MKINLTKILASAVLIGSAFICIPAYGYNVPDTIRVGLEYRYKEVMSVPVSNGSISIGCQNGEDFDSEAKLNGSAFVFSVPDETVIDTNEFYPSYDKALNGCEDLKDLWGYDCVPAYVEEGLWGVYIYNTNSDSTSFAADTVGGSVVTGNEMIVLKDSGKEVMFFNGIEPQIKAEDNDGIITLSDRSYRGRIEFGRYKGNKITAVNVVDLEHYLYGTVPSEMPSSWNKEAIKAQAVAARSYALTRRDMKVHAENGYELCDGTNCQVYIGYSNESASAREAVDETKGELAYYNGVPINAVFFSSSGGSTDDSENVWNNTIPYLKAVPEINETAPEWTREFTQSDLSSMLSAKGKGVGTVESITVLTGKYGRVQQLKIKGSSGEKTLSAEETRTFCSGSSKGSLLSRMYAINEKLPDEKTVKVKASAYIDEENTSSKQITVCTSDGNVNVSSENIYAMDNTGEHTKLSGNVYAVSPEGEQKVTLEEAKDNTSTANNNSTPSNNNFYSGGTVYPIDGKFIFYGRGNGHGVGMSQCGAKGMADAGYTYKEILKHYYTDITVE